MLRYVGILAAGETAVWLKMVVRLPMISAHVPKDADGNVQGGAWWQWWCSSGRWMLSDSDFADAESGRP